VVQSAPTPRPEAVSGPAADQRRRAILGAASRLFRERGLHATGMREIAAELGMTAGNLYYYFPSKQELLAYCQEQTLGQLLERARAIRRLPLYAGGKLRRLIEGHVAVLNQETPGSLAHLEVNEVPPARRAALLARRRSYEAAIRALIEEGIAAGEFRAVDSRLAALALLGALNWTVKWFSPDGRKAAAEVGAEFADLLLAGLLRRAAARQRRSSEGKGSGFDRPAERPRSRSGSPPRGIPAGGGGAGATAAQRHGRRPVHTPNGSLRDATSAAGAAAKRPEARPSRASTENVFAFGKKGK
jgi:AcrR family transcriptional regulator